MNILQINKFYFNKGGAERYQFALTQLFARHGHRVFPFAMASEDNLRHPMDSFFISPIITERPSFSLQGIKTLGRFFWSFEAATKLGKLVAAHPISIAHCHNIYHQVSPSILPVLKKRNIPIIMTLHDFHVVSPAYNLYAHGGACTHAKGGKFFNTIRHRCVKHSYIASALCASELRLHRMMKVYEKNIDCFIAPSHFMADTIQEWGFYPKRVEILPNFVEPKTFQPFPAQPSVLFAGRLSEEKGIRTLLQVISKLPDFQFTIAGTGPMKNEVKMFAESHKNVTLLGHTPPEKMDAVFAHASLVIVPSLAPEVFPMVILEAFAHGRPVIASHTGGIPESIIPGKTGELVELGNGEVFAQTIARLVSNETTLQRMGNAALALVKAKYSPHAHYQQLMRIYQSLITSP